jgi:hypothetical protein
MPFDQVNFVLPAVETDEVLQRLIKARDMIANPDDWCCVPMRDGHRRCAFQALMDAGANNAMPLMKAAALVVDPDGHGAIAGVNVIHGHVGALRMYDLAIDARRAAIASSPA